MSTLTHSVRFTIDWLHRESLDLATFSDKGELTYSKDIATGTAVDTCDRDWSDTRTITAGANDDLDLTALTSSVFGSSVAVNFAKVKEIAIICTSETTGDMLVIRTNATNGFTGWANGINTSRAAIGPDSLWYVANKKDGWAVSGSDKVLRINNPGATSVSYKIFIAGTSA